MRDSDHGHRSAGTCDRASLWCFFGGSSGARRLGLRERFGRSRHGGYARCVVEKSPGGNRAMREIRTRVRGDKR